MKFNMFQASLLAASALSLAACGGSDSGKNGSANATPSDTMTSSLDTNRARDGALGDMVLGNADAKVTLVEYASFTCGHCATFHASVFPDLKTRFIETGMVKFIFRELPTPPQELSYIGSVLARCAADKGGDKAFFAISDGLFTNQREWVWGDDPKLELLKITNQAGMDESAINACLERQEIIEVINANVTEANEKYKITGTPSFVLDDKKLDLKSLADLESALTTAVEAAGGTVPAKAGAPETPLEDIKTEDADPAP